LKLDDNEDTSSYTQVSIFMTSTTINLYYDKLVFCVSKLSFC